MSSIAGVSQEGIKRIQGRVAEVLLSNTDTVLLLHTNCPPVDLHWFFEISSRTEKKIQLEQKKKSVSLY